jgi:hypothetical protein
MKTRAPRTKKRIPCEVKSGQTRHAGMILDMSASGLFIQTSAAHPPGTRVSLDLNLPNGGQLVLQGSVARRKMVPARLRSVETGGIGVRLDYAPEEFFQLIARVQGAEPKAEAPAQPVAKPVAAARPAARPPAAPRPPTPPRPPAPPRALYRVRVAQAAGARSRFVDVRAESVKAAQAQVLAELGEGWKVLSCELRRSA